MFLETLEKGHLDSNMLLNLNSDSCAILCGHKSGVMKRIKPIAPNFLISDISGDVLHHVHNSLKRSCKVVFKDKMTLVQNICYDIRSSPFKVT